MAPLPYGHMPLHRSAQSNYSHSIVCTWAYTILTWAPLSTEPKWDHIMVYLWFSLMFKQSLSRFQEFMYPEVSIFIFLVSASDL